MRIRLTRLVSAAAVVFAVGTAGAAAGSGSALAAEPVVVGSCATTVQGAPGTPVALSTAAVLDPIVQLIRAVPLLGPPLAEPFRQAFSALPPIPIGAIPTGTGVITGGDIANKVNAELVKLPLLGPIIVILTNGVRTELTKLCGVTVQGVNAAAAPVQDGSRALADVSEQATGQLPGLPGRQAVAEPAAADRSARRHPRHRQPRHQPGRPDAGRQSGRRRRRARRAAVRLEPVGRQLRPRAAVQLRLPAVRRARPVRAVTRRALRRRRERLPARLRRAGR